jgi:Trk-type K+ transport system membrane component
MENIAIYILAAFAVLIVVLNSIATYIVFHTYFEDKNRRLYQTFFIWLIPIVGALLAIYINKEDYFAQKYAKQVGNHPNISERQAITYASAAKHRGGR